MSKCDLHIHSRYSARSEEWLFRRLDFPDSYSDPRELHRQLLERGMDYVTITDHDTIDGCLEILDLPNTFISEQVTTYFPQDPCKVHILVWGISEAQHADIVRCATIFSSCRNFFRHARSPMPSRIRSTASMASWKPRISSGSSCSSNISKGLNGLRDALLSELAQSLLDSLTPDKIDIFANRHNLAPTHPEPWRKIFTGGSDDHGGQFIASAYTETPAADSAKAFLEPRPRRSIAPSRARAGLPSPFRTVFTTRFPVSSRTVSTRS